MSDVAESIPSARSMGPMKFWIEWGCHLPILEHLSSKIVIWIWVKDGESKIVTTQKLRDAINDELKHAFKH